MPEEMWTGDKPSVSHLRVFGSLCYCHIPNPKRKKLEISRDITVLENDHRDWDKNEQVCSDGPITPEDTIGIRMMMILMRKDLFYQKQILRMKFLNLVHQNQLLLRMFFLEGKD